MKPFSLKPPWRLPFRIAAAVAGVVAAMVVLVLVFPWDWLRGPLNRYVSERTGRQFEITRRLEVVPGWRTRVRLDGVAFANPGWATDPFLIKAESAEFEIRLLPLLLHGRLELPTLVLRRPQLGLQMEPDGRRTWALGRDTADPGTVPVVGLLEVDAGELHYLAAAQGVDIRTTFAIDPAATNRRPLSFQGRGRYQQQPLSLSGSAGSVLVLNAPLQQPFPLALQAVVGASTFSMTGTIATLAGPDGVDAEFALAGASLADLYKLTGVVLPATPRYRLGGHLARSGRQWNLTRIRGLLGQSDIAGDMTLDRTQPVAMLRGTLSSRVMDFEDLAPLVGLQARAQRAAADRTAPGARVLPVATLDLERLKMMNADVRFQAARIAHVKALPLERAQVHVRLTDGVLLLDPLQLGVAGGTLAGRLQISANTRPAGVALRLDARALQLNQLFPTVPALRSSLGLLHGLVDLRGSGNSVARMLGAASGDVSLAMGPGQISNLLLEYMGLDGGEIFKFMLRGDRNVALRCAAAAFDVRQGLMRSRAMVLDTSDTVVHGTGTIHLATELLDLTFMPEPKDTSILSLRSPLKVSGSFAAPKAGVDKGALAGRAGLALALGMINPLLALAATLETGPGVDADCKQVLAQAAAPATAKPGVKRP